MTAPVPYQPVECTCGEFEVAHNIRTNGQRGACSVSRGPKATPCGCTAFRAAEEVAS